MGKTKNQKEIKKPEILKLLPRIKKKHKAKNSSKNLKIVNYFFFIV